MHVTIPELAKIDIKQTNRRNVLSDILLNGPSSRTQLAEQTGLAPATISRTTQTLLQEGLLREQSPTPSPGRSGRRVVQLDINPEGGFLIGLSFNAFELVITLGNLKESIASSHLLNAAPLDEPATVLQPSQILSEAINNIRRILVDNNIRRQDVIGVGVSAPGAVDSSRGIINWAPTMGWENVVIGDVLAAELGLDIYVANIPNAMNLAETRFGVSRGFANVVLLNAALGVGASLFLDNHLIHGNSFRAGVLGGLELLTDEQGKRISIADAAGGWGVIHAYSNSMERAACPSPARLFESIIKAASSGEARALAAMRKAGTFMGRVFELVEGITHPDLLMLSGPLSTCEAYVQAVRDYLSAAGQTYHHMPELVVSEKSIGEASRLLALHEFLLCR
ncbi:MAG: ROK family protein [Desulfopila sp.]